MNAQLTVAGWLIVFMALYAWSKSKTGYSIIYMVLSLILVLLVLQNYDALGSAIFKAESSGS